MSTFWEKKIDTYFERIDVDKDGIITRKDFEAMGDRFADLKTLSEEALTRLRNSLTAVRQGVAPRQPEILSIPSAKAN